MGLVFDTQTAKLYGAWYSSSHGRFMDKSAEEAILTLLEPQASERILDIGCGEGNHLLFFSKLGLDINGVDASPYMINRAKDRLGKCGSLQIGTAEDLPFEDNEFDLAVLINTLEFLDDPLPALREAGRVAKRKVFIGVMNSLSWHCLARKLEGLFRESFFNHLRFYNLWELKSFVQTAFGNVPVVWSCAQIWSPSTGSTRGFLYDYWNLEHCPFGAFLWLAVTIVYKVKTDNLPLKARMKKARESIASGLTRDHSTQTEGVQDHERGLFV